MTTTTTNPSTAVRNPETRQVLNHWLERMTDVEGTIHRNNGTVVLLVSGKEIASSQAVDAPVLTPLDQIVKILDDNGVDLQPERVAAVRHWLQTAGLSHA